MSGRPDCTSHQVLLATYSYDGYGDSDYGEGDGHERAGVGALQRFLLSLVWLRVLALVVAAA